MTDIDKPTANELLSCKICLKEIPASSAKSEEVKEYVYYFCGADCYKEWQDQDPKDSEPTRE